MYLLNFSVPWFHDTVIAVITAGLVLLSIFIPKALEEHNKISKFTARKLIHSLSGLAILITPYLYYPIISGFLALCMTIITRTSGRKSPTKLQTQLFEAISEAEENEVGYLQGPYAYCLAITVLVFIYVPFADLYYFPIISVLMMMYSDTLAAYVGKKYGSHPIHIKWVGNKRTLEGSASFFVSSLVISFGIFFSLGVYWPGISTTILNSIQIIILSFSMSFIATGLELLSPSKYDDLIVPLGTTMFITLVALALGVM